MSTASSWETSTSRSWHPLATKKASTRIPARTARRGQVGRRSSRDLGSREKPESPQEGVTKLFQQLRCSESRAELVPDVSGEDHEEHDRDADDREDEHPHLERLDVILLPGELDLLAIRH